MEAREYGVVMEGLSRVGMGGVGWVGVGRGGEGWGGWGGWGGVGKEIKAYGHTVSKTTLP